MTTQNPPAENSRSSPPNEARSRLRSSIQTLFWFGGILTGVFSTAGFFASWWWPFELLCHFRMQYLCLLVLACLILFALRKPIQGLVLLVFVCPNIWVIAPFYQPRSTPGQSAFLARASTINLLTINRKSDLVIRFVEEAKPDVIFFSEYGTFWQSALTPLKRDYPFFAETVRDDNFGFAIFSRHKVDWGQEWHWGRACDVTIPQLGRSPIRIFGAHPVPPSRRRLIELRNSQIDELSEAIAKDMSHPVVVLGDLNSTSWSPAFSRLVERTGLVDTRRGLGVQPSWPSHQPLMYVPIDHILVSREIEVGNRWIGPNVGSDHLPVVLEFGIR